MDEIEVLYEAPVIFTKDTEWVTKHISAKPGAIILLPQDAVLYAPPTIVMGEAPKPHNQDTSKEDLE